MTRIFAISLMASFIALWAVSAKAFDLVRSPYVAQGSFYPPAHAWPRLNRDPAITKTLRTAPQGYAAAPVPQYQYEWQSQPAPPAPSFGAPRFSFPQQGYYPREGTIPQTPGYEYDSGDAGTYPPSYPMEGANWRGPRTVASNHASAADSHTNGTYLHCPR